MSLDKVTLMQKIEQAEQSIKSTEERLQIVENRLNEGKLPEEKEKLLKIEVEEVKKLLETHKEQLAHLRTHNRNTFIFVVILFFIFFSLYMLYILVIGVD